MPPFPGAHQSFSTRGLSRSFQIRACSRPPPPTTKIFIPTVPSSFVAPSRLQPSAYQFVSPVVTWLDGFGARVAIAARWRAAVRSEGRGGGAGCFGGNSGGSGQLCRGALSVVGGSPRSEQLLLLGCMALQSGHVNDALELLDKANRES